MIGERHAKLTIIGAADPIVQTDGKRKKTVLARCDCGTEKIFVLSNVLSGNSRSCGCEKYKGLQAHNRKRAKPQKWTISGGVALLEIAGHKVLVDRVDLPLVDKYRWGVRDGYAVARGGRLAMHRLILGLEHGDPREGDHVHHNTTDNRRSELRIANSSQNKMNRRGNASSTSPFKGVSYEKARDKYRAQIKFKERKIFIGRFDSEIAAAAAYNAEAERCFGKYAFLNKI